MSTSKISDENFFTVHGWMLNRLSLKGSDLQVYAIIYGFSQDGQSEFSGSLKYLQDFTGLSRQTVINSLNSLTANKLITKISNEVNGVQLPRYKVNLEAIAESRICTGSTKIIPGSKNFIPNNIVDSNTPSIDSIPKGIEPKDEEYIVEEASTSYPSTKNSSKNEPATLEELRKKYKITEATVTLQQKKMVSEVIDFLNKTANKNFRDNTPATARIIIARLNDGYTVEDMKKVIQHRWEMWKGSDMEQYMRPSTLFRPSKFEDYLNAVGTQRKLGSRGCPDSLAAFGTKQQKPFSELSEEEQTQSLTGRKF